MKKNKWIALLVVAVFALLLVVNVLAMSSPGYALEWYVPGSGAGGGEASSASYAVNMTVGQTVIGPSSSASYHSGLGYWYGTLLDWLRTLPIVFK